MLMINYGHSKHLETHTLSKEAVTSLDRKDSDLSDRSYLDNNITSIGGISLAIKP